MYIPHNLQKIKGVAFMFLFSLFSFNGLFAQTSLLHCPTDAPAIEVLRFRNDLTSAAGSNITIFINPKCVYGLDNEFKR